MSVAAPRAAVSSRHNTILPARLPRRGHGRLALAIAPLIVLAVAAGPAQGAAFQWTGGAGTSTWNDADNWLNLDTGTVSGFPTLGDTAAFGVDATVRSGAAGGLTVGPGVTVTFGGGSSDSTDIASTLANNGIMTFAFDGSNNIGSAVDQRLFIAAGSTVTLTGTGTLALNGSETGVQGGDPSAALVNAAGHTIAGDGTLRDLGLTNAGTLRPEGGTLTLDSVLVDNTGGTVELAANGTLAARGNSGIDGGTLHGTAGAAVRPGNDALGLTDLTLTGSLEFGGGSTSSAAIGGTLTNEADITFVTDGSNNSSSVVDQRLFIAAGDTATLAGSGSLTLNGSETGIQGGDQNATLVNGVGHTVHSGDGTLRTLTVINQGRIEIADGDALNLRDATIRGGVLGGAGDAHVNRAGGRALLEDMRWTGALRFGGGSTSSVDIAGTITNDASVTFAFDGSNNSVSVVDQRLFIEAGDTATLAGSGSLKLNGSETGIQGGDQTATLVNAAGHTIAGDGTLRDLALTNAGTLRADRAAPLRAELTAFTNEGLIEVTGAGGLLSETDLVQTSGQTAVGSVLTFTGGAALELQGGLLSGNGVVQGAVNNTGGTLGPGNSPGTLQIDGDYAQGPGGTLAIELGGTAAGAFDVLEVTGSAAIDGLLALTLDGFLPDVGSTFDIVVANSITGLFSNGPVFAATGTGIAAEFTLLELTEAGNDILRLTTVSAVPLPASLWLLLPALGALARLRRRPA